MLARLRPKGELVTVPEPVPEKVTLMVGSAPPVPPPPPDVVLVKQTTFAVINPVTMAPDEDKPDPSVFVCRVAETRVPPHARPVAVSRPVELTVNICVVFETHVTWFVISLVTGGWR